MLGENQGAGLQPEVTGCIVQAPMSALGFRVTVTKWLSLVRLLLGEVPEHTEFTAPGLAEPLAAYFSIAQAVRAGDLTAFRCARPDMAVLCMQLPSSTLLNAVSAMDANAVLGMKVPEVLHVYVWMLR